MRRALSMSALITAGLVGFTTAFTLVGCAEDSDPAALHAATSADSVPRLRPSTLATTSRRAEPPPPRKETRAPTPQVDQTSSRVCSGGYTVPAVRTEAIHTPARTIPGRTIPGRTIPGRTIPATTLPGNPPTTIAATTIPATTIPATTLPTTTIPAATIPATTIPALHVPRRCFDLRTVSNTTIRISNYDRIDPLYDSRATGDYWRTTGLTSAAPDYTASGFGGVNAAGFPKNQYVRPYVRRDGTFVSGYWRNSPTDGLPTCRIIQC